MEYITVDGEKFNPYFMLDVVPEDSESFITKSFRKKAKMWHPDKIKSKDPQKISQAKLHFKVLIESYEYIINKKRSINHTKKRERVTVTNNTTLTPKKIDNTEELHLFNEEFDKLHITHPNDYGYETAPRLSDTKEYENFTYKPYKLFNPKKFNRDEFNKIFEYQQQLDGGDNTSVGLYHQTTDGFNGYNSGTLDGAANVSSYNGIMITGDTFGQNGTGYYDTYYSDYKKSFEAPKNPHQKIIVPDNFEASTSQKITPLTDKEFQQQKHQYYQSSPASQPHKHNFKYQEQMLLEKQGMEIKQKLEHDKNLILQYKDMYADKSLIQSALDNKLLTSNDYVNEETIHKRFKTI